MCGCARRKKDLTFQTTREILLFYCRGDSSLSFMRNSRVLYNKNQAPRSKIKTVFIKKVNNILYNENNLYHTNIKLYIN